MFWTKERESCSLLLNLKPVRQTGVGGRHYAPSTLPLRNDPVSFLQEAEWTPELSWTGAETLASTGFQTPNCPPRSDTLPPPLKFEKGILKTNSCHRNRAETCSSP